ncbi:hypothetical protein [Herminiimonas sp. CN]|uniref:hypothetical protein n=1 Tax=Herminiimonas sp. CN TaxID=1349818 RepID=UPI0012DDEE93|nr:hypothetical protein [Herminiimonas sp. CN]
MLVSVVVMAAACRLIFCNVFFSRQIVNGEWLQHFISKILAILFLHVHAALNYPCGALQSIENCAEFLQSDPILYRRCRFDQSDLALIRAWPRGAQTGNKQLVVPTGMYFALIVMHLSVDALNDTNKIARRLRTPFHLCRTLCCVRKNGSD